MIINSYAVKQAKSPLAPFKYETKKLKSNEIEVKITHCGICHSDIHLIDNDWGISSYPLVPGHEIIGIVNAAGSSVTHLKEGQRVGIGWQAGSCHSCEWCLSGNENLCTAQQATCVGRHGGFAEYIHVDSKFAFLIPDSLESENAAPLLCAGVTVYSPMRHYGINCNHKVGIIGIGGLGHIALQFANSMGCEVTALSTNAAKEGEAIKLGAHRFVVSTNMPQMKQAAGTLDYIISTVSAKIDWRLFMSLLRPNGKLIIVGAAPGTIEISPMELIVGQKSICGSSIGGSVIMNEMLEFASRHGIKAMTEIMPIDRVNEAIEKVRKNTARYRMVLKIN
ncbi:MAG: NAD(P)-dependent alcohol dehydrogenase [Candidatus Wallbacteria bacterium]